MYTGDSLAARALMMFVEFDLVELFLFIEFFLLG